MKPTPTLGALALSSLLLGALALGASPQIKLPGGRGVDLDLGRSIDRVLKPESPLSTRHADLYSGLRALDGWNPTPRVMTEADKVGGRWVFKEPGSYRMALQAFCGRGYAKGPFRGLGYGVAAFRGSEADILQRILRKYETTDGVEQKDAQLLIWSILSRVKPSKMSSEMRANLALLLHPKDIARLEGFGLDEMKEGMMNRLTGRVTEVARPFLEAENRFRGMMYRANVSYDEVERLMVPIDPNLKSTIAWGRWIPTRRGYLVRYLPQGYRHFDVEVVVPHTPKITRDAKGRITRFEPVPGSITEVTYADEVAPLGVPGEPKLVAYAVKHIRLVEPDEETGGAPHVLDLDVETCLLKGTYSGRPIRDETAGLLASLGPAPLDNWFKTWGERAKTGKETYDDIQDFKKEVERQKGVQNGQATMDGILDTEHYEDAVKSAAGGTGDAAKWLAKHQSRLREGVAGMIKGVNGINSGPGGEDEEGTGDGGFIPSDTVAVPGNPGGQLGLVSGKSVR